MPAMIPRTTLIAFVLTIAAQVNAADAQTSNSAGLANRAPAATNPYSIDIPAGDLTKALLQFSKQYGADLVYRPEQVHGLKTKGAHGTLTTEEAVNKLLEGTNLKLTTDTTGAMFIRLPNAAPVKPAAEVGQSDVRLRLAQADEPELHATSDREQPDISGMTDEEIKATQRGIPEVLVRGLKAPSLNADIERTRDDIQPYVVFDHDQIERSGAIDIGEFLQSRLTMNYVSVTNNQSAQLSGNTTSIALNGLNAAQTLILVDGRRLSSIRTLGSQSQPDLNGIPLDAIERIEVLPTTASGIYGGSATGGVVNVILRRDYSGVETKLGFQNSVLGGGATKRVDISGGFHLEDGRTSVLFNASTSTTEPLLYSDRHYVSARREFAYSAAGEAPDRPPLGSTTNICSATVFGSFGFCDGSPLTLKSGQSLGGSTTFVPPGYAGASSDGGTALIANAGKYNYALAQDAQVDFGAKSELLNSPIVRSINATVRRQFSSFLDVFFDLSAAQDYGRFTKNFVQSTYPVLASSPTNPFTQDIFVSTPIFGLDEQTTESDENDRALLGFIATLPKDWKAELDLSYGRTRSARTTPSSALTDAAASAITSGSVDVLRDTSVFPTDFSQDGVPGPMYSPERASLSDVTLHVAGEFWNTPAGPATLSFLAEHRSQQLAGTSITTFVDGIPPIVLNYSASSQKTESIYSELNIPLVGSGSSLPGIRELDVQLAGRLEEYRVVASVPIQGGGTPPPQPGESQSSANPTLGIRLKPIRGVVLRASYATGFLPPDVSELLRNPPFPIQNFALLMDPKRGNELLGTVQVIAGGNPDLLPEKSKTLSAGIIVQPELLTGLRFSADYSRIRKRDNAIALPYDQDGIAQEDGVPGLVTRAPKVPGDPYSVGPIIGFDQSLRNASSQNVRTYNFALDYTLKSQRLGVWNVSGSATRLVQDSVKTTEITPAVESARTIVAPEWAANAELTWGLGNWRLGWAARYLDSYFLYSDHTESPVQGSAQVPSIVYHDVFAEFTVGKGERKMLSILDNCQIQLGVKDLFNSTPRFSAVSAAYSDPWGNPMMATYYVTIRKGF